MNKFFIIFSIFVFIIFYNSNKNTEHFRSRRHGNYLRNYYRGIPRSKRGYRMFIPSPPIVCSGYRRGSWGGYWDWIGFNNRWYYPEFLYSTYGYNHVIGNGNMGLNSNVQFFDEDNNVVATGFNKTVLYPTKFIKPLKSVKFSMNDIVLKIELRDKSNNIIKTISNNDAIDSGDLGNTSFITIIAM